MMERWGWISLREDAALQSGDTATDTSISLVRWQQGEEAVAGVGTVFKSRLCEQIVHVYRDTSKV